MIDARRKKIYRQSVFGLVGFLFFALAIIFVPNHFCLAEDQSVISWVGNYALGGVGYVVALVLGFLAQIVNAAIGVLISVMIGLLVGVAQFNNIIDVDTVKEGWKIVRDICNMFFVLILLAIAIGTILKLENYSLKKMLPKLLIMAILINFSRMIFGVIIDFAQVIMLTFVSAFSNSQGWFIDMFNVQNISSMQIFEKTEGKVNGIGPLVTVTAILAGVFASLATLIIVIVLLLVLIVRIVMLWIYTILSPLVFLGFAFPAVGKHTSRIWEDFIKQVMIGPLLAFFIYLALTTADASSRALGSTFTGSTYCPGNLSAFFCSQDLQKFIITIGLLAGGLMVAQQMGGAAGSIAGKGMAALSKARSIMTRPVEKGLKAGFFKVGRGLDSFQAGIQKKIFSGVTDYSPKSLNYRMIAEGWKKKKAKDMQQYEMGLGNTWAATFDKYANVRQYGAWRKSRSEQEVDENKAKKLDYSQRKIQERINNSKLSGNERRDALAKTIDPKNLEKLLLEYMSKGFGEKESKEQIDKDILSLIERETPTEQQQYIEESNKEIAKITAEATKLRDHVKFKWVPFDQRGKYQPRRSEFDRGRAMDAVANQEKELKSSTNEKDYLLIESLISAINTNDEAKATAAFNLLADNNDSNEALKDSRIINLMAKENGFLEKLYKQGKLKGIENNEQFKTMVSDFRSNPVSPAYLQALVQGAFMEMKVKDSQAARYADMIGGRSFAAGNSLGYGMSYGDVASGGFKFQDLQFNSATGQLVSSVDRMNAIIGKFANMESQSKIRSLHPDVMIREDANGNATGISEEGKAFIMSLTGHDLGQISRLRLDVIRKIASSKSALQDLKKMIDSLEDTDKDQANIIRNFTGYIINTHKGQGLNQDKHFNKKNIDSAIGSI